MRAIIVAVAAVCLVTAANRASARDPVGAADADQTASPYFVVRDVDARLDPLPLREVAVHADVSGVVADVTVTQLWENTGPTALDATYVFPLSTRAAVHALEMRVGGRRITAHIEEREAARRAFDAAAQKGQRATLLEEARPNVFTSRIANVRPGDVIEVEVRYVELLLPTDGIYSLVVPRAVGPRYVSPQETDPALPWSVVAGAADADARPAPTLHAWPITVRLDGGLAVRWAQSSSHAVELTRDDGAVDVELVDPDADTSRDFVLDYALGGDALESGVLVQPDSSGDGGHFLALVEPPERVAPELVPRRDYVFIVDTSGSMNGWPLALASRVVGGMLDDLDEADRVNVLCFSGGAEALAPKSLPATRGTKARARAFLDSQRGAGSTELIGALHHAFATPAEPGVARTFVVITDGFVTVEAAAIDLIRERAADASVFAVGVGDNVNRHLIEAVARAGGGEPYVAMNERDAADLAETVLDAARAPVLTRIALRLDGIDAYDVEPQTIPTLYASRPLVVTGRYRGRAAGTLTVEGESVAGLWRTSVALAAHEPHPAVPLLWARERIARLSDFAGAHDAPNHQAEVTALGLGYHLVTAHTSFVAIDESSAAVDLSEPTTRNDTGAGLSSAMSGQGLTLGAGAGGMGFSGTGGGGGGGTLGRIGDVHGLGAIGSPQGLGAIDGANGKGAAHVHPSPRVHLALQVSAAGSRALASGDASVIRRRAGALRACLEHAASAFTGRLLWRLALAPDGLVKAAHLEPAPLDAPTIACMRRNLMRLRFATRSDTSKSVALSTFASEIRLQLTSTQRGD